MPRISKFALDLTVPIKNKWLKPVKITRRCLDPDGYVIICVRNHSVFGSGRVAEHRLVMMEKLKRKLRRGETVHHDKVRNKTYNNPNNLVVLTAGKHIAIHNKERIWTDAQRKARSNIMKGNKHLFGHRHTIKTKLKMSKSHMGWNGHTILRDRAITK